MPLALALSLVLATPHRAVRNLDAEVIETALLAFFSPEHEEWQDRSWRKGETLLLWGQLASKIRKPADDVLNEWIEMDARHESDPVHGKRISASIPSLHMVLGEMRFSGLESSSAPAFSAPAIVPLATLAFDPRIVVGEPRSTGTRRFRMWQETPLPNGRAGRPRAIVRIDPPAYSKRGDLAVVKLNAPWSIHSADVLIGLRREGDGWKRIFSRARFFV